MLYQREKQPYLGLADKAGRCLMTRFLQRYAELVQCVLPDPSFGFKENDQGLSVK